MKHIKLFEEYKFFKGRKTKPRWRMNPSGEYEPTTRYDDGDEIYDDDDGYDMRKDYVYPKKSDVNERDPNEPFFVWNKTKYSDKKQRIGKYCFLNLL